MDEETKDRIRHLRAQIRQGREALAAHSADSNLKGLGMPGFEAETAGRNAILARIRALQDELQGLLAGTAEERKL